MRHPAGLAAFGNIAFALVQLSVNLNLGGQIVVKTDVQQNHLLLAVTRNALPCKRLLFPPRQRQMVEAEHHAGINEPEDIARNLLVVDENLVAFPLESLETQEALHVIGVFLAEKNCRRIAERTIPTNLESVKKPNHIVYVSGFRQTPLCHAHSRSLALLADERSCCLSTKGQATFQRTICRTPDKFIFLFKHIVTLHFSVKCL